MRFLVVGTALLAPAIAPAAGLAKDPGDTAKVPDHAADGRGTPPVKEPRIDKPSPEAAAPAAPATPTSPAVPAVPAPSSSAPRTTAGAPAPAAVPGTSSRPASGAPRVARRQPQRASRGRSASRSARAGRGVVRSGPARAARARSGARTSERARKRSRADDQRGGKPARAAAAAPSGAPRAQPRAAAAGTGARETPAETRAPVEIVGDAAGQIVAVVPAWLWALLVGLTSTVAALLRRTMSLASRRRRESAESCDATVRALAAAVEAKDACTAGHLERVQRLGLLLAAQIVPSDAKSREMAHGFLLHDVGKLAVPDAILTKPGRLDPDELEVMRSHADAGAKILDGVPGLGRGLDIVRHHHERWDGQGYPAGLAGREIPLWARIFSVIDTLDAMTSDRPYAERRPLEEALAEVEANAGSQFDPAVVRALLRMDRAVIAATLTPPAPPAAHARRERALVAVA